MKKVFCHTTAVILIFLICFGLFAIGKDAYLSLYDYQFVVELKTEFIEEKRLELIDIVHEIEDFEDDDLDLVEQQKIKDFWLFKFKSKSKEYKEFEQKIKNLSDDEMHVLFNNIFGALDLPMEMIDGFTSSSKAKFIIDLFSMESKKDFVDYKFTFIDKINSLLKSDSEDVEWQEKLNQYIYKSDSIIDVLTGLDTNGNYQAESSEQKMENNKNHDCWIDRKFNFNFFSNINASDGSYSVLPSLISTLWIGIFILVTILTISLFLGLYLFAFVDENSKFKKFFLKLISFYASMPEPLLAIFGFIILKDVLKADIHSILLLGLILSLIICPLVVKIVIRSLNMLTDNLKNDLQMTEAKVKLLVNEVLPLIMPYVAYHLVKVLAFVTNFGLLFFILCGSEYSYKVPRGFSSEASSLVSDILISLTTQTQNHHLISAILFVVMLVNLLFYLITLFLKRFISFKLIK